MSSSLRELDFEPVEEHWNNYLLADHTKVRARLILLKLFAPQLPEGKGSILVPGVTLQVKPHVIFVVSARPELKGPPGPPLAPGETDSLIRAGQIVKIVESREEWNVYRILETGESFKTKLVVSDVYRVPSRFDPDGEPIYIFTHTITFMPGPPQRYPTP